MGEAAASAEGVAGCTTDAGAAAASTLLTSIVSCGDGTRPRVHAGVGAAAVAAVTVGWDVAGSSGDVEGTALPTLFSTRSRNVGTSKAVPWPKLEPTSVALTAPTRACRRGAVRAVGEERTRSVCGREPGLDGDETLLRGLRVYRSIDFSGLDVCKSTGREEQGAHSCGEKTFLVT